MPGGPANDIIYAIINYSIRGLTLSPMSELWCMLKWGASIIVLGRSSHAVSKGCSFSGSPSTFFDLWLVDRNTMKRRVAVSIFFLLVQFLYFFLFYRFLLLLVFFLLSSLITFFLFSCLALFFVFSLFRKSFHYFFFSCFHVFASLSCSLSLLRKSFPHSFFFCLFMFCSSFNFFLCRKSFHHSFLPVFIF